MLYQKYRPNSIRELVGEKQKTAATALLEGPISNLVFFTGPKGSGKTTLAGMYAKRLAEGSSEGFPLYAVEINCRMVKGVDYIRDKLTPLYQYKPLGAKYSVVFLDEVDALSDAAQQALLSVEQAPPWVVIIMATRNPSGVRSDLLSRCAVYELKYPTVKERGEWLKDILDKENWDYSNHRDELRRIVENNTGDMRELLNSAEQLMNGYVPTIADVESSEEAKDLTKLLVWGPLDINLALESAMKVADPVAFVIGLCRYAAKARKSPNRLLILQVFGDGLPTTMPPDVGLMHKLVLFSKEM